MGEQRIFSAAVTSHLDEYGCLFRSDDPLSRFVIIDGFLDEKCANILSRSFEGALFDTFCIYTESMSPSAAVLKRRMKPNLDFYYISVQERVTEQIAVLEEFAAGLESRDAMKVLSRLTGIELRTLIRQNYLSRFRCGHFLERHTDWGQGVKLSLSINFTLGWQESWGGEALYAWKDSGRSVVVTPQWNRAVLFAPSPCSVHWVEAVRSSANMPRLSCTFHFC